MSKIGKVNFELQEQAEELGFESVQEALDNGCKVHIDECGSLLAVDYDKAIEEAHGDYNLRKKIIIDKLEMLISDTPYKVYKDTLKEAIDFINEKEI